MRAIRIGTPRENTAPGGNENLDEDKGDHDRDDLQRIFDDNDRIQQHPHGNEEERNKGIAKGNDVAQRLMTVFRFGNGKAGNKCAQGQGKTDLSSEPGRAETDKDNRQNEQFPTPAPDHLAEYPGNQKTGTIVGRKNNHDGFC